MVKTRGSGSRTVNRGMKLLENMIKYCIYSGFLDGIPRPLSLLIVANTSRAKSSTVVMFDALGVRILNDVTAFGLERLIKAMTDKERETTHHFIIPDLERISGRGKTVKREFLATMRILEEEGLTEKITGKIHLSLEKPFQAGFICATTPEDLGDRRSIFRSLSWLNRRLIFTYEYSDQMMAKVLEFIEEENHIAKKRVLIKREEKASVVLPRHYARKLTYYARFLGMRYDKFARGPPKDFPKRQGRESGIRPKENLMTLLKSIALYNGRTRVNEEDFDEFRRLWRYINFKFNYFKLDAHAEQK